MKWKELGEITVLVADDDLFNRQLIKSIFNHMPSVFFVEATNGIETLKSMKMQDIDILLLDIYMPLMNGFETIKEIRSHLEYDHIPVLTISTDESAIDKMYQLGIDDHMIKPFDIPALAMKIYTNIQRIRRMTRHANPAHDANSRGDANNDNDTTNSTDNYTIDDIEDMHKHIFKKLQELTTHKIMINDESIVASIARELALLSEYKEKDAELVYHVALSRNIGSAIVLNEIPYYWDCPEDDKKTHTEYMTKACLMLDTVIESVFSKALKSVMRNHKEHYDGSGFPEKKSGDEIDDFSYIIQIVEMFHALLSSGYRDVKLHDLDEAIALIAEEKGKRLSPKFVDIFLENIDKIVNVRDEEIRKSLSL